MANPQPDTAVNMTNSTPDRLRILVVDDDAEAAEGLKELLEGEGHTVGIALDGKNAQRSAVMMNPDAALVDLRLGEEWGLDVVEELRKSFPDIIAVILTGESDSATVIRALRQGIYDYLTKPYEPDQLIGVIGRVAEKTRLQSERSRMLDELAAARDRAELASRSKTEFLTRLSGELGEQFNTVVGLSGVIARARGQDADGEAATAATDISNSCRRLSRIMMWIGELGQLEAGTMPLAHREFSLRNTIDDLVKVFDGQLAAKHLDLSVEIAPDLPHLQSDSDHFARVIGHLISNAVRFTGNGGKIEIAALVDGFGDLRIDIRDSGIGMSEDDLALAMVPFGRLHSIDAHDPYGVGLGLPLAEKFTRLLGGKFEISSALGSGTAIKLRFTRSAVFEPGTIRATA